MADMKGYLEIPKGGLNVDGVAWPEGVREMRDTGWFNLLKAHGAKVLSYDEYARAVTIKVIDGDGEKKPKGKGKKA